MSDTDRIASTLAWSMVEGVWHSAYLVCAIVMMLILNWKMALCVLVIVPIVAISSMYFQKKLVFFHRQVREKNSRITGAFNEGITGATTTKTLVVEDKMEKEFDELTADMKKVSVRAMHFRAIFISTTTLAASLALALVLWRGGIVTREGLMLIGTLTVFMNYAQGMMEPIQWLVQALSSLVNVQVNVERFTTLMETESDVQDTPEVVEKYGDTFNPKKENWEELHGDIEFCDVTFRYPDGDENILEHFNLKVPQGTNVAIVGETGAGKSTLVNLVCRFYEPTEGRVLIDGRGDILRRYGHGAAHSGRDRKGYGRTHVVRDRPPALHDPPRGHDPRRKCRKDRRARQPRRAHGEEGRILWPLHPPVQRRADPGLHGKQIKRFRRTCVRRIFLRKAAAYPRFAAFRSVIMPTRLDTAVPRSKANVT